MPAPDIVVTQHAIDRWRARVDPAADPGTAAAAIRTAAARAMPCIVAAGAASSYFVKLPTGVRLVLSGLNIVTVLAPEQFAWRRRNRSFRGRR